MGSLPLARFVQRERVLVSAMDRAGFDWVSAPGTPRELALIRVQATQTRRDALVPIGYVTPLIFVTGGANWVPSASAHFLVMDELSYVVNRSEVDVSDTFRQNSPPGQLNWGLGLHLIRGCTQAQVTYWQWT
jgi:hypothetical protein